MKRLVLAVGVTSLLLGGGAALWHSRTVRAATPPKLDSPPVALQFIENAGQWDAPVEFAAVTARFSFFVAEGSLWWSLGEAQHPLKLSFDGARPASHARGEHPLPGRVNSFIGSDPKAWRSGLRTYSSVVLPQVFDGVDVEVHSRGGALEYDFRLAPGVNPEMIRFRLSGADEVDFDADGNLVVEAGGVKVTTHAPIAWQLRGSTKEPVPARLARRRDGSLGFDLGHRDESLATVIDPVMQFSSFLGGSLEENGNAVALDQRGNMYVAGYTRSANFPRRFPLSSGSGSVTTSGDAFVTKVGPDGRLVYSTYLGGSLQDRVQAIAVDDQGNAYVTGSTSSSDFPVTAGVVQAAKNGFSAPDCFVTSLAADGRSLRYSTFLGGDGTDFGTGIDVDATGRAYLGGRTNSANYPTAFPSQASIGGGFDAFATVLNDTGTAMVFSTWFGGSSGENGNVSVALDSSGKLLLGGETSSNNLPTTTGAFQESFGGSADAFLVRFNTVAGTVDYATYLGGSSGEAALDIAAGPFGTALLSGYTCSSDFPLVSALQPTKNGPCDAYVARLNATGSGLVFSTYLGGSANDEGSCIATDSAGVAYVGGYTDSPDFPLVSPVQRNKASNRDAIVFALAADGSQLLYSTLLGGSGDDNVGQIAAQPWGDVLVTGNTTSPNFPVGSNLQRTYGGGIADAFVSRIALLGFSAGSHPSSGVVNDPVNVYTGELLLDEPADLALGGPLPLEFRRTYASRAANDGVGGLVGINWSHNFEWSLALAAGQAEVVSPSGRRFSFSGGPQPDGGVEPWVPAMSDTPVKLVPFGAGQAFTDLASGRIFVFDALGVLQQMKDRRGNALTLSYSGAQLTGISDGLGRTLTLGWDVEDHLGSLTDGTRTVTYTYVDDQLTRVVDALGQSIDYGYSFDGGAVRRGLLTSRSLAGRPSPETQQYDTLGRVTQQVDALSGVTTYSYQSNATVVVDALGHTSVYGHGVNGALASASVDGGASWALGYDSRARRSQVMGPSGASFQAAFDVASEQPSSAWLAADAGGTAQWTPSDAGSGFFDVTRLSYSDGTSELRQLSSAGDLLAQTDPAGHVWKFDRDARGLLLGVTPPDGGTTVRTWNADGTLATEQAPGSALLTYGYDALRRRISVTRPDGGSRTFTWDALDRPLTLTDENGATTTWVWNADGLAAVSDPTGRQTRVLHDAMGRLSGFEDDAGTLTFAFNAAGRLRTVTNGAGNTVTLNEDGRGAVTSVLDADGHTTLYARDLAGQVVGITNPLGDATTYQRDAAGRVVRVTTPESRVTQLRYDALGRLTQVTGASGDVTTFGTDTRGFLNSVSSGGATVQLETNSRGKLQRRVEASGAEWKFTYDPAGRLLALVDPQFDVTSYVYDLLGQVQRTQTALGTLDFTRDALGRVTRRQGSDSTDVPFTYDAAGRLLATDGLTLGYDLRGDLAQSNGISGTRDGAGRLRTATLAAGKTVTYQYDGRGNVTQVTDWTSATTTLAYDAVSRLTSVTRPNGVVTRYGYDRDGLILSVREEKGATVVSSIVLTRDGAGRVGSAVRTNPSVASAAGATVFRAGTVTRDAMGRATANGAQVLTWSLSSELNSVTEGSYAATFAHDGLGYLRSRSLGGVTRTFVWNHLFARPAISVEQVAAAAVRYHVHTPDGALLYSVDAAGARRDFHFDELGNTIFLTDAAGAVTDSWAWEPYGVKLASSGTSDTPFTFLGRWGAVQEAATGLFHIGQRVYDSGKKNFLSRDPIPSQLLPTASNPYQYALNDPMRFVDVTGRSAEEPGRTNLDRAEEVAGALDTAGTVGGVVENVAEAFLPALTKNIDKVAAVNPALLLTRDGRFAKDLVGNLEGLAKAGKVADAVGNVASTAMELYKTKERIEQVRKETTGEQDQNLLRLEGQLRGIQALLATKAITPARAAEMTRDAVRAFEETQSGALKAGEAGIAVEAVTGFKNIIKNLFVPASDYVPL